MKTTFIIIRALVATAVAMVVSQASALTFQLNTEYSGGQAPGGTPPWLVATFTDNGPNDVKMTLTAPGLVSTENASEWDFNLTDAFVGHLVFNSPVQGGSFTLPTIGQSLNGFPADGGGYYDINLAFAVGGNTSQTFGLGDSLTYDISANNGTLTANDFNHLAAPHGGHGPFFTAAHVQNTTGAGTGGSGWIAPAIPEPSATLLVPLGGILATFLLRFRSKP
jgi:hypothetical protein